MDWDAWAPIYERILTDLGLDRAADERARDRLADVTGPFDLDLLRGRIAGGAVAIVAPGPPLDRAAERSRLDGADAVIAAGTAADRLLDAGRSVDCVVTDLDGSAAVDAETHAETVRTLTDRGTPAAVHAHGDNGDAIAEWVPAFAGAAALPTTQAAPTGPVRNFGGFTDGDRAAFLADALGAARLDFVGWALDDPGVGPTKRRKLDWAARLLRRLEARRDEWFTALDGVRGRGPSAAMETPTERDN
jgi:uncharacterized Rossmann fold enzyme